MLPDGIAAGAFGLLHILQVLDQGRCGALGHFIRPAAHYRIRFLIGIHTDFASDGADHSKLPRGNEVGQAAGDRVGREAVRFRSAPRRGASRSIASNSFL